MSDALIRAVVHIHKQRFPIGRECRVIHSIAMILRSDEALGGSNPLHGLVVRAVTVFQFVCLGSCRTCQQLIA